jgi:hypothetical protein
MQRFESAFGGIPRSQAEPAPGVEGGGVCRGSAPVASHRRHRAPARPLPLVRSMSLRAIGRDWPPPARCIPSPTLASRCAGPPIPATRLPSGDAHPKPRSVDPRIVPRRPTLSGVLPATTGTSIWSLKPPKTFLSANPRLPQATRLRRANGTTVSCPAAVRCDPHRRDGK